MGSTARIVGNLKAIGGILVNDVLNIFSITTGLGVVLQGYTGGLRIAVNGSGETGGSRGNLTANNADFSGTLDVSSSTTLNGTLRINNQSSGSSGGNSGQHLIINLDGTTYKIRLELP